MLKRLLSVLLCLCMVLTMCPVGFAETVEPKEMSADPALMEGPEEQETEAVYETEEPEAEETTLTDTPEEIAEPETDPEEDEIQAFAQPLSDGMIDAGSLSGGLTWTLTEDGVLTISGSGEMPRFAGDGKSAPWYEYRQRILCAMVDQGITGIGDYAFYACDQLDTVQIGENVESIGAHAFDGCAKLLSVRVPENVQSVGGYAFFGCTELRSVSLPEGLTEIGTSAFEKCTSLKRMDLPGELERVSDSLLKDCTALTDVTILEGVGAIGSRAFSGCTALGSIALPQSVTDLGGQDGAAFQNCRSLTKICIPEQVTAIYPKTFAGCTGLTEIVLPECVASIGESAFDDCESLLTIHIPEGITQISDSTFQNCTALKSVILPAALIRIDNRAFYNCSGLTGIQIPDGVQGIGSCAFEGCASLDSVVLPEKITAIENNTFEGCIRLQEIVLPMGLGSIGDCAFMNCTALRKVELPAETARIGASAFRGCPALCEVSFGQGLTEIGDHAFSGCGSLPLLELPEKVTSIGGGAFENCGKLEKITFPNGLKTIGDNAFRGCGELTQINLPDSVTGIGARAFESCEKLERVILPQGLTGIEESLFENCACLETVSIPKTVTAIGTRAFSGCKALGDVSIPESVARIGQAAFFGCKDFSMMDMSRLPQLLQEQISLTDLVPLPECLKKTTGGRAALVWELESVAGEKDCGSIAEVSRDNGKSFLRPISSGRFRLVCRDGFTGIRGSRILEAKSNLEIRPVEEICLSSGNRIQLTVAALPGGEERTASWSLAAADGKTASITADGWLTAKTVAKKVQVTVTATLDSGDTIQKTVTVLPRATAVGFLSGGKPIGKELEVDMSESRKLNLSAVIQPEDALSQVRWGSGDERVAMVDDDGTVTLLKPGTAAINASCTDGSGVSGQVNLVVRYLDAGESLTLTSTAQTLEPGQTAQLTLTGENSIDPQHISFTVSDETKATVDESGILTAGESLGEVTVTAGLKGDPLLRTAQVKLRIREGAIREIRIMSAFPDDRGYEAEENGESLACIESGRLAGRAYTFHVTALGMHRQDSWQAISGVTFESENPAVAVVGEDGTVTVKARIEGECVITARCAEGAEARLKIQVRDSSPRLESNRLALNSYQNAPVSTELVESYGNGIQSVSIHDYDRQKRTYSEEPSGTFYANYTDGKLWIGTADVLKNGTYSMELRAVCRYGMAAYPIQIKVANSLPRVDIRQSEKFDLFYLDSAVPVAVSASGQQIKKVELADTASFQLEWTGEGTGTLQYAQDFQPGTKPNTRGTLRIFLEGWREPVVKPFSIAAYATRPRLTIDPGSSVVNLNKDPACCAKVYWGSCPLDLTDAELDYTPGTAELAAQGENLIFRLVNTRGGTVSFTLRQQNWTQAVRLSYRIGVENKLPALRLKNGNLRLNGLFPWQTAQTAVWLTQSNQLLGDMTFISTAKAGSAQQAEAEKLLLTFDPEENIIRAGIRDGEKPRPGNYMFSCVGFLPDGTALPAVNLKIAVGQMAPRVRLSAGAIRMNKYLAGRECVQISVTTSDNAYRVVGFQEIGEYKELSYEDGCLSVCLTEDSGNGTFRLTPIVEDTESGQCAALPDSLKLGLSIYNTNRLGIAFSAKGRLDTLDPDSAVTYLVTRLTNCTGAIEEVSLEGPDAEKFRAEVDLNGGKPEIRLRLLEGEEYDTRLVYQIQFRFFLCGKEVLSPVQRLKVTQSALRVTVPRMPVYYLGQRTPLKCALSLSASAESIVLSSRTDKTFLAALEDPDNMEVIGDQIYFHIQNPSAMRAGKSYAIYLDITPEHNAVNVRPSQVRLIVKAMK